MQNEKDVIGQMLGGLNSLPTKPSKPKKTEDKPDTEQSKSAEFSNRTLRMRKSFYNRLRMESIRQDRFIWQVLEDALAQYLKDK